MKDADNALSRSLLKNKSNFSFIGNITGINVVSTTALKQVNGKIRASNVKRKSMLSNNGAAMFLVSERSCESTIKLEFTIKGKDDDINSVVRDVLLVQSSKMNMQFIIARV